MHVYLTISLVLHDGGHNSFVLFWRFCLYNDNQSSQKRFIIIDVSPPNKTIFSMLQATSLAPRGQQHK